MPLPLLDVRNLTKHFVASRTLFGRPSALVKAVDGVSFTLGEGETLALVGESGCGKSTVGRLVLDLLAPTSGKVIYEGQSLAAFDANAKRRFRAAAQLIFQDPYASLNPRMTIGQTLDEPLMLHTALTRAERTARVGDLLETVGLTIAHARRYPHEFSGGQRQRIAIARALAVSPRLIVCDEPVSALDVSIRAQVLNLLDELRKRLRLATIFISHDLSVVKHIADRVAVMYLGRIVETAPTDQLFREPRHPYTQALLSAIPIATPKVRRERRLLPGDPPSPINPPAGCHLHTRCPHAIPRCSCDVPALIDDAKGHSTACHRWQDIGGGAFALSSDAATSQTLERLLQAFAD